MRRVLVWTLALFLSHAAFAQTLTQQPVSQNPVSRADMTGRLEESALETRKSAPQGAARGSSVDFAWASDPAEYRALAKHLLVLVSVVTQDAAELPLRRVYVNIDGRETELVKLSSQLGGVRKGTKTYSVLGPYREDGFYLAPAGIMMVDGYAQARINIAMLRKGKQYTHPANGFRQLQPTHQLYQLPNRLLLPSIPIQQTRSL